MRIPSVKEVRGFAAESFRQAFEGPLYSAGIGLYRFGVRVAGLSNPKARKLDRGQKEIFSRLRERLPRDARVVWVHAASLGEFEQGRPLIEKIRREQPDIKILLTFFSPSGYEVRKDYAGADCVCYLPFDTPGRVRRFLDIVRPEKAIFVKYEIWRNYLQELYRRSVPTYLISAAFRPDQWFFCRGSAWYGLWLKWYTRIFVQDRRSKDLLASIRVDNVDVAGDTRFDRVTDIRNASRRIPELERFARRDASDRPLLMMMGSSWPADEDVYAGWVNRNPQVKVVIAPHEFDGERVEKLCARFDNGAVRYTAMQSDPSLGDGAQVLVMDCFGLLSSAYSYCDIAYVGGGFGAGLHNINEAAVYGVPVIYGPNNHKFIEAAEMSALGGGLAVQGREGFEMWADKLTHDPVELKRRGKWAGEYIAEKIGATDRVYRAIFGDI